MNNGYKEIYMPTHPQCGSSGTVYEHRLVAEKMLGRYLNTSEYVHHINGDKQDNSANNLMVFASNGDHSRYHNYLRLSGDPSCVTSINSVYSCTFLSLNKCKCGKVIDPKAKMCKPCSDMNRQTTKRPKKEILVQEIKSSSYSAVGRKYGVSDNAIRKWVRSYSLNSKTLLPV